MTFENYTKNELIEIILQLEKDRSEILKLVEICDCIPSDMLKILLWHDDYKIKEG